MDFHPTFPDSAVRPRWTAFFFLAPLLSGDAAQRPTVKKLDVSAASVSRDDGEFRRFFVQFAKLADDFVGENRVIVTVPQEQRLAHALFESAFVVHRVPNVEQAPRR